LYITIKNSRDTDEKAVRVWFPCEEERLSRICDEVGIVMSKDTNCFIVEGSDRDFIDAMRDFYCNVDELNFLTKRLDSFNTKERNIFYAAAVATDAKTMTDLINLTYNTHCYSVISDFNNLDEVGKDIYLNEAGGVSVKEMEELDGRAIAEEIMKNSPIKAITNYGVVYQNRNEPELVYDGKHFPLYCWKDEIAMVELSAYGEREYLYLPCSDIEISKALMRLEVDNLIQCDAFLESDYFPENMVGIITKDKPIVFNMKNLNEFANKFREMGKKDESYFEKLIDYIGPRNESELKTLLDSMHEFEMFDEIKNAEQYGRYMICDSGYFKYDENLENYIDFKGFGEQKINNEHGAFTDKGYIIYYGYNKNLQNLLSENLGMMMERRTKPQELKLYMPLRITTYDVENDYGYMEKVDYEEELSSSEILTYMDEILDAIEKNKLPEEEQRGLMKYYRNCDSVNAKVSKYEFTVEEVKGELKGVAVLTLNDALSEKELEKIKSEISGQASDGWGEGFEQREINIDGRDIYVSFWGGNDWSLKTAEELGIEEQIQKMGGMSI